MRLEACAADGNVHLLHVSQDDNSGEEVLVEQRSSVGKRGNEGIEAFLMVPIASQSIKLAIS